MSPVKRASTRAPREPKAPKSEPVRELVEETIALGKQALVFVNAKRSAESVAEDLARGKESANPELAKKILKALSSPTAQCKRLAFCVDRGTAFHHAGLVAKQRELVEQAFLKGDLQVIVSTPTLCLAPGTPVWSGMRDYSIEDSEGAPVLVAQGNVLREARGVVVENANFLPLLQLETVSGHSITITENHQIPVRRGGRIALIPASSIQTTDEVATAGKITVQTRSNSVEQFVKENDAPIKGEITSAIGYCIGAMLGDGYSGAELHQNNVVYKGSPSIVGCDQEVFDGVRAACTVLHIPVRENHNTYGVPQLVLGKHKWFREFLARTGIDKGKRKHIPVELLEASDEVARAILQGLFDTDGCVERRGNVSFSNISSQLIANVQRMLLRFGIVSRKRGRASSRIRLTEKSKEYTTAPSYEIIIAERTSLRRFKEQIGFRIVRKQKALEVITAPRYREGVARCSTCNYTVPVQVFSGRTKEQREWGFEKQRVVRTLVQNGPLSSKELREQLGFTPYRRERRLNQHFEMIERTRQGKEIMWKATPLGVALGDNASAEATLLQKTCCVCKSTVQHEERKSWRTQAWQGDLYWDRIRSIERVAPKRKVYDLSLPEDGTNEHLFIANGILVHNSAGINIPAFRVIIRDLHRFEGGFMAEIPVLEYLQQAGRAGRPDFHDDFGEAVTIAKAPGDVEWIQDRYWDGEPEPIHSKLASLPALRTAILSLYATGFCRTREDLRAFFEKTFFAHQYKSASRLDEKITDVELQLGEWGFLVGSAATPLGRRVSQLYIDPLSAHTLLDAIASKKPKTDLAILHTLCSCVELRPLLRLKTSDFAHPDVQIEALLPEPSMFSAEYEEFLEAAKTAAMLGLWIEEAPEEKILENYGVRPGELRAKLEKGEWLLYAASELYRLTNNERRDVLRCRIRLKYGVKAELLPLLRIKGVGRVRARALFKAGLTSLPAITAASDTALVAVLGPVLAGKVREQLAGGLSASGMKKV